MKKLNEYIRSDSLGEYVAITAHEFRKIYSELEKFKGSKNENSVSNFKEWLEKYGESGIHLEGLSPFEYGQAIWAVMNERINKIEKSLLPVLDKSKNLKGCSIEEILEFLIWVNKNAKL